MSKFGDFYDEPTPEEMANANSEKLRRRVNEQFKLDLKDFWQLHRWTCENPNEYWKLVWRDHGIIGDRGQEPLFDGSKDMKQTRKLIPHARLNFAENLLFAHSQARSNKPAIICCAEAPKGSTDTHLLTLSWSELTAQVARCADALQAAGVKAGDVVAAFIPCNAEAIISQLAAASLGAIFSSCPGEFGSSAVLERFSQISPTVLITADAYRYNEKDIPMLPKAGEIASALKETGLKRVVVVGQLSKDRRTKEAVPKEIGGVQAVAWNYFLEGQKTTCGFWRGSAMAPLWVLYSSGTTGKPKAIVHHAGGMLFAAIGTHAYCTELNAGDVMLQFTTTGWMMFNFLLMSLAVGTTVVAYDGSPFAPMSMLWDLVDQHKITCLGISPRYLQVLLSAGYSPRAGHSLSSLRTMCFAGAPVKPELYDFVLQHIKRVFFGNGSGGTDICSAFIGANRLTKVHKGEIQAPLFGIDLQVWDDEGNPLPPGSEGNMVIARPFVNQPLCFINDKDDQRYHDAYFNTWPNKPPAWNQSDWLVINPDTKGIVMLGRSDGVLNPSGVRFGSAELYAIVEQMKDEVDDCIAIGQKLPDGDERVILFVKPVEGRKLDANIVSHLKSAIAKALSARHVPAVILECPEIPYTATYKRVEVAVKKIVNGQPLSKINTSALVNPRSLEWFVDREDLRLPGREKAKL